MKWLRKWWQGKYIEPPKARSSDDLIFMMGHYEKHWTSKFFHWFISLFTNPERRAIFLAVIGFITFIFMIFKYFDHESSNQKSINSDLIYQEQEKVNATRSE